MLSPLDLTLGYTAIHANAPPSMACGCFSMNGGSAQLAGGNLHGFGLAFDFGMTTASDIGDNSGHDLILATFLAGPRYTFRTRARFTPYAQALLGAAQVSTNNAIDDGSIAFASGGGVDLKLTSRFSRRITQAEYLLTQVPNGLNNIQNQLRLTSGIVFHLRK